MKESSRVDPRARKDIELTSVDALPAGDLEQLSDATASELSLWLEHTKHQSKLVRDATSTPDGSTRFRATDPSALSSEVGRS